MELMTREQVEAAKARQRAAKRDRYVPGGRVEKVRTDWKAKYKAARKDALLDAASIVREIYRAKKIAVNSGTEDGRVFNLAMNEVISTLSQAAEEMK